MLWGLAAFRTQGGGLGKKEPKGVSSTTRDYMGVYLESGMYVGAKVIGMGLLPDCNMLMYREAKEVTKFLIIRALGFGVCSVDARASCKRVGTLNLQVRHPEVQVMGPGFRVPKPQTPLQPF